MQPQVAQTDSVDGRKRDKKTIQNQDELQSQVKSPSDRIIHHILNHDGLHGRELFLMTENTKKQTDICQNAC